MAYIPSFRCGVCGVAIDCYYAGFKCKECAIADLELITKSKYLHKGDLRPGDASKDSGADGDPQPAAGPLVERLSSEEAVTQKHYTSLSPEPIDVIEGWGLGFRLGCVVKYVARAGRKPGVSARDDLVKALAFLKRELNAIDGKQLW